MTDTEHKDQRNSKGSERGYAIMCTLTWQVLGRVTGITGSSATPPELPAYRQDLLLTPAGSGWKGDFTENFRKSEFLRVGFSSSDSVSLLCNGCCSIDWFILWVTRVHFNISAKDNGNRDNRNFTMNWPLYSEKPLGYSITIRTPENACLWITQPRLSSNG